MTTARIKMNEKKGLIILILFAVLIFQSWASDAHRMLESANKAKSGITDGSKDRYESFKSMIRLFK